MIAVDSSKVEWLGLECRRRFRNCKPCPRRVLDRDPMNYPQAAADANQISSTIPANGDLNPYGLVFE